MSVLTPRQRVILRGYARGKLADILIDPERGIREARQSRYGRSGFRVDGEEFWVLTTARGIELCRLDSDGVDRACDVLAWSAIARFARSLPARLVAEVRECRRELYRVAAAQPKFPTRAGEDEQQRWERDTYRPWLGRKRDADARLDAALDAAFAAEGPQPALFDLATARHVPPPTRRTSPIRESTRAGQDRLL
jgi:hypothetical protein